MGGTDSTAQDWEGFFLVSNVFKKQRYREFLLHVGLAAAAGASHLLGFLPKLQGGSSIGLELIWGILASHERTASCRGG